MGKDIYFIVDKPDSDLPVYNIKRAWQKSAWLLYRNLLLPFMGIPFKFPSSKNTSDPVKDSLISEDQDIDGTDPVETTDNC